MGKGAQADLPGEGRTFRRRTSEFWSIWPIAPYTGEVFDVVFLDGLWVGRDAVVLWRAPKSMWSHGIWRRANVPRHGRPS